MDMDEIEICSEYRERGRRVKTPHFLFLLPVYTRPKTKKTLTNRPPQKKTTPKVILDTLDLSARIKKTPVVVGNCTGFAVNRVFFPYTMGACILADLGVDVYRIDKVRGPPCCVLGECLRVPPRALLSLFGAQFISFHFISFHAKRAYVSLQENVLNVNSFIICICTNVPSPYV